MQKYFLSKLVPLTKNNYSIMKCKSILLPFCQNFKVSTYGLKSYYYFSKKINNTNRINNNHIKSKKMIKDSDDIIENKSNSLFKVVDERINFPQMEHEINNYWDSINAFKKQLEKTKDLPQYTFYDGPPFATGTPHYGHITAGTLKDVVTRYWTQNGYYVERRFGWDCHGLPIECIINDELQIKSKKELMNYGIANYNKKCREGVMKYADEWEKVSRRFGRWIDFRNDYKTMNTDFMESVWWVFKQIFDKGLVYRKCKVMLYSWACNTVLSNFEAGQAYKTVEDPSIYITFPFLNDENTSFIVWTTTPWTLPSNLAIVANPELEYVMFKDKKSLSNHQYIVCSTLLEKVCKELKFDPEVVKKMKGIELEGIEYAPLYTDFYDKYKGNGCFKLVCDKFVTATDGTGIVHAAPGFGEEDFNCLVKHKLIDPDNPLCPIDDDGKFTSDFKFCEGILYKDGNKKIMEDLHSRKRLLHKGTFNHQYPMCYRTGQPLIYKAIPSWFINVESVKNDLIENNKKAYWIPKYVQEKRFHNWLKDARDWCISRSRSWGNPIPLWVSDDFEEKVVVGSIEELCELAGLNPKDLTDIHKEFVDEITIPSKMGKGKLRRIPEIFDCWFESGSMPYAQLGYPKKTNHEQFSKMFPADFIAEGIDQTRGWFYTLNIISTIIFNINPYKNLIVNGLVLNEKGVKMSKKEKNYPDPNKVFEEIGADAVRLYLMNSQLVKGQSLNFKESGVSAIIKDVFLPLYNSYKFLIQNIQRYEKTNKLQFKYNEKVIEEKYNELNLTDQWILAYSQRLIKYVRTEMEAYRLYTVVSGLLSFFEKLSNWYIRLNRNRIKGDFGANNAEIALNILFKVTFELNTLLSPLIPFLTEHLYQNLKNGLNDPEESVHFLRIPVPNENFINPKVEKIIQNMICVINQGRYLRETKKIMVKMPVAKIQIINSNPQFIENLKLVENYIIEELNTNELEYIGDEKAFVKVSANPNYEILYTKNKEIGELLKEEGNNDDQVLKAEFERTKAEANAIGDQIRKLNEVQISTLIMTGEVTLDNGTVITTEQVLIKREFLKEFDKDKKFHINANSENSMRISTEVNDGILNTFYTRDLTNRIQKLRKETGIVISDDIVIQVKIETGKKLESLLKEGSQYFDSIVKILKVPFFLGSQNIPDGYKLHYESKENDVAEENVEILIFKK